MPGSFLLTLKALVGGMGLRGHWPIVGSKVWQYQTNANINVVKEWLNYSWERLPF